MRGVVDRVLAALDGAAKIVIVLMVGAMVAIVAAQVTGRYLLGTSIGWADEVSRLTFVWTIFLAIPLGIRLQSHIGIALLTQALPALARDGLARLVAITAAALMALVAYESAIVALDQWDERMASFEASAQLFIVAVAIGTAHSALHLVRIAVFGAYGPPHQLADLE